MLDQEKTGRFLSETRKELHLTQREVADELGISDKTISKWETGRGLPDASLMAPLCDILHISANELLSGERLSGEESYERRAEENMIRLVESSEQKDRNWRFGMVGGFLGLLLIMLFVIAASGGIRPARIIFFLDAPSLMCDVGLTLLILAASGRLRPFLKGLVLSFHNKGASVQELQESAQALTLAMRATLLAGCFGSIVGAITILSDISDLGKLGPSMAVMLLTLFYSVVLCLILLPMRSRLQKEN